MARYDNLAAVALSVAGRTGRKVPDDLMVTGFDNDFISNYVSPALTTVEIQKEEVAKSAMEALLSLIRHDGVDKNKLYSQTGHQESTGKNVIVNSNEKINKYNLPGAGRSENIFSYK